MHSVVVDTNILIAALRSRRGASYAILRSMGASWSPLISVSLIFEYESVGKREAQRLGIPESTVDAIVNAFCAIGREVDIHFRTRPTLPDPDDEFLLELAVAGRGSRRSNNYVQCARRRRNRPIWNPSADAPRLFTDNREWDYMSRTIHLPDELYQRAAEFAEKDHVSVEEFVATMLVNQLDCRDYVESRAMLFNREEFERALETIPDVEPQEHDRLS